MRPIDDVKEWDELFARVEHPHLVQTWAYGEAKRRAGGGQASKTVLDAGGWRPRRAAFTIGGQDVAICQFMDKSIAGIACASRINRGPMLLDAGDDPETVTAVYQAIRNRRQRQCGLLVMAPGLTANDANVALLRSLGFRQRHKRGWVSSRIDIRMTAEELRAHVSSKWRNRLKVAERSNLSFCEYPGVEGLEWIIARHIENMADKAFEGPAPDLLRALYQEARGRVLVFQALLGDEPAGGMLVYRFGRGAEYYVGWMSAEGKAVNVGNYLYYNIALELQRRGCQWIDLGGQRPGHTEQFKRGMRGTEYELLNEWIAY
jgi:hypothetical protein